MHPLITDFLDHLAAGTIPATTLKALRGDLATLERWYATARGRPLRLEDVTPLDVDAWMRHTTVADQTEAAPATANRRKQSFRRLCQWAIDQQVLRTDPTRDMRDLPLGDRAPRSISDAAVDRLLHAARQHADPEQALRDEAMRSILAFCGLRVEELCQLTIADLNLSSGTVTVRHGKGGKRREVHLLPRLDALLRRYLTEVRCPHAGIPARTSAAAAQSLWVHRTNLDGRPWTPGLTQHTVQLFVRAFAEREAEQCRAAAATARRRDQRMARERLAEELAGVTLHTFRHSLLSRLIEQGVELPEVQAIAGHSSLRVTGMYLTPHEGTRRSAIERGADLRTK